MYVGGDEVPHRNLSIRVEEELFREIKIKLAQEGKTLREYLLELIDRDLNGEE